MITLPKYHLHICVEMQVQINTLRKFLLHHATYTPAKYEVATSRQGIVVQIDESKFA